MIQKPKKHNAKDSKAGEEQTNPQFGGAESQVPQIGGILEEIENSLKAAKSIKQEAIETQKQTWSSCRC